MNSIETLSKTRLLEYEMPSIAEHISNPFLQSIISKYVVWKINRKIARFDKRQARKDWLVENSPEYQQSLDILPNMKERPIKQ